VLLHFKYSSAAFAKTSRESACDKVVSEVRQHLRVYVKGHKTIFDELSPKLPTALQNAKRLERANIKTGSDNPSTKVYDLVEYLLNLKEVT
jgi:RloB-like protein